MQSLLRAEFARASHAERLARQPDHTHNQDAPARRSGGLRSLISTLRRRRTAAQVPVTTLAEIDS